MQIGSVFNQKLQIDISGIFSDQIVRPVIFRENSRNDTDIIFTALSLLSRSTAP